MPVGKNSISRVAGKKAPAKKTEEPVITPVAAPVATEVTIAAPAKKPATEAKKAPAKKPATVATKAPAKRSGNPNAVRIGEALPVYLL